MALSSTPEKKLATPSLKYLNNIENLSPLPLKDMSFLFRISYSPQQVILFSKNKSKLILSKK